MELINKNDVVFYPVLPKEYRRYQTMNLDDAYEQGWEDLQSIVAKMPTIDAVKHGRWKYISFLTVECSECKTQIHDLEYFNFCPSCGARMDAETRNNTEEKLQ